MALHGHIILIIEPDLTPFVTDLQDAIERERGETIVARDPASALSRCRTFKFTAALVNAQHRDMVARLTVPAMPYDSAEGHRTVMKRLRTWLSLPRPN